MKKKQLEIFLQQTPDFPNPDSALEQYKTPAPIAAEILFFAYQKQDITGKKVVDLGCGTGIFSFGAARLNAKNIIGIDKDPDCIALANSFAQKHHLNINFLVEDIANSCFTADTVLMNPPFGAQKANIHADKVFLEKAIKNSSIIYSLHLTKTVSHLKKFIKTQNASIDNKLNFSFPLKGQFSFHKKLIEQVQVSLLRITRLPAESQGVTR